MFLRRSVGAADRTVGVREMEQVPFYVQTLLGILLLTCFVKVLTVLSIVRYGLGLELHSFGIVVIGLAFGLSCLIMEPVLQKFGGLSELLLGAGSVPTQDVVRELRPFLIRNTDAGVRDVLLRMTPVPEGGVAPTEPTLGVLIPGFLLSEVASGFTLGLLALLPLVVIDLLAGVIVSLLGMQQLSPAVIALPCKLLLFVAVNGWLLVSQRLVSGYGG